MFIAVPDKFKERFSDVSPDHWRVQAVTFDSTLIINVYLPTDPGTIEFNDHELSETLGVIQTVLDSNQALQVILAGDFNTDFSRNTGHVDMVNNFIHDLSLNRSWSRFQVDFTHVTSRNDITYIHTLDHFFWGEATDSAILDDGVIHHVDNDSDHSPIFCSFLMPAADNLKVITSTNPNPKPSWKKSSEEEKTIIHQNTQ